MLTDAIGSLGQSTYTVKHRVPGGDDGHGRVLPPTVSTTNAVGMLQPFGGKGAERLPEGLHAREVRYFFTTSTLVVVDHDAGTIGDHLVVGPNEWEVVKADEWAALGSPYNRYIVSRVDP